jgi:hypothetical protein
VTDHPIRYYNQLKYGLSLAENYGKREPVMPTHYEIRINNRLEPRSVIWFDGMTITVIEETRPPQTIISGYVRDQAALYGLINRVRDLGLILVSVSPVDAACDGSTQFNGGEE